MGIQSRNFNFPPHLLLPVCSPSRLLRTKIQASSCLVLSILTLYQMGSPVCSFSRSRSNSNCFLIHPVLTFLFQVNSVTDSSSPHHSTARGTVLKCESGTSLVVQGLGLCTPSTEDPGSIPGRGIGPYILQLRLTTAK